ncbi:MAG: Trk system potassium transporter TrkA [Verrucomicrobiales bacterium]|nr:Trk system potassium transporter TrkA [Verrucomicrobiales bacterium]
MKIVIVGAGEIGTHLAKKLAHSNHSIVVIDADEAIVADLESKLDVRVITGDGAAPTVQLDADVPGCDVFFALTSDNYTNLVASTVAKKFEAKRTVCRLHQALEAQNFLFDFKENFGVDEIFSSERLAAVELSKHIRNPDSQSHRVVEEIAGGFIEVIELPVPPQSDVIGKSILELNFPHRARICVIKRDNEILIPSAKDILRENDILTIAGSQKLITDVVGLIVPRKRKKEKNVVIFGGGEYGYALAQTLSASGGEFRIRIFEEDRDRCDELADELSNVTLLNADATSLSALTEENVGDADFFVATTAKDEDNVMTCLQANSLGTTYCLSLFHRADYADAITKFQGRMGILAAVSPREATSTMLMRFVVDTFQLLRKLDGVELIEVTVAADAPVAGTMVKETQWPQGSVLVGLWHSSEVVVPSAEDRIESGDSVYAMVTKKTKRQFLDLFSE